MTKDLPKAPPPKTTINGKGGEGLRGLKREIRMQIFRPQHLPTSAHVFWKVSELESFLITRSRVVVENSRKSALLRFGYFGY